MFFHKFLMHLRGINLFYVHIYVNKKPQERVRRQMKMKTWKSVSNGKKENILSLKMHQSVQAVDKVMMMMMMTMPIHFVVRALMAGVCGK